MQKFSEKLPVIENDTDNIIEYVDNVSEKRKEYTFWDLLKWIAKLEHLFVVSRD